MSNHFYSDGNWIILSIFKIKDDKLSAGYDKDRENRIWGVNEGLVQNVIRKIFKEVIPDKASQTRIMDVALTAEEVYLLKNRIILEINYILSTRNSPEQGFKVNIFNTQILIDIRNNAKSDMLLYTHSRIMNLIEKNTSENSTIYLKID